MNAMPHGKRDERNRTVFDRLLLSHNAYIKTQLFMYVNDKKILKFQGSWDIINLADVFEKYRQKRNELVVFIIRSAFVGKSFA